MSSPTISMSCISPAPRPISWARRMNLMLMGSKPIILADTASTATWSAPARMTFFTCHLMARGPGPSPTNVPSVTAKMPGVYLLLDVQEIDERFVDDRVRPVALSVQESAECVLHRASDGGEDVRLHRRQVDDVLAEEHLRDLEALRVDVVEGDHLGLRREVHPLDGREIGRKTLWRPCFCSTASCLFFCAPSTGSTTTVPLCAGMRSE